jgi:hypothetical protein
MECREARPFAERLSASSCSSKRRRPSPHIDLPRCRAEVEDYAPSRRNPFGVRARTDPRSVRVRGCAQNAAGGETARQQSTMSRRRWLAIAASRFWSLALDGDGANGRTRLGAGMPPQATINSGALTFVDRAAHFSSPLVDTASLSIVWRRTLSHHAARRPLIRNGIPASTAGASFTSSRVTRTRSCRCWSRRRAAGTCCRPAVRG